MLTYRPHNKRIHQALTTEDQALVARNRGIIRFIAKCFDLCAHHQIANRRHRDDPTPIGLNQGNFCALIAFRAETDTVLAQHLQSTQKNTTYVSNTAQNDLLEVMGDNGLSKIVEVVSCSKVLALEADEITDASTWEELGVVFRYVPNGQAKEKLLAFAECASIRGEDIFFPLSSKLSRQQVLICDDAERKLMTVQETGLGK